MDRYVSRARADGPLRGPRSKTVQRTTAGLVKLKAPRTERGQKRAGKSDDGAHADNLDQENTFALGSSCGSFDALEPLL